MQTPTTAWDRRPTDKELNSFYGDVPTQFDVSCAIERHVKALDRDDLIEICHEFSAEILRAIHDKNSIPLLEIFSNELKAVVARSASVGVYGDAFVIKASQVTL